MSKLPNDPLLNISLQQLIQKIKSQTISCEEVTKIYLKRIELLNKKLHSYIYIDYEGAIKSASAIDNLIKGGAGQAVQNLNFYYKFNSKKGLI